jgi:hypothetical protein
MDASDAAAWQALLPANTEWLRPRSRLGGRGLRRQLSGLPSGTLAGVPGRGWRFGSAHVVRDATGGDVRCYVALPSTRRPVIVADRDPALLRYVSGSLLTVPPGVGPVASFVLTVGLQILRLPGAWAVARAVLPGGMTVGRLA